MNPKKLLSVIVAAAVAVASASTLALTAYPTLLPLPQYSVEAKISGYDEEQIKAVPLKDVLSQLKYSSDYTIQVPGTAEDKASTAESTSTGEAGDPGKTSPAGGEVTMVSKQVNKGDPVEIAPTAVKVWVSRDTSASQYSDEYSILDNNATVDLSYYYNTSDDTYKVEFQIIVGSGKQLDPGNIIYNADITVTKSMYKPVYDMKFYTLDADGNKNYISAENDNFRYWDSYDYSNFYSSEILSPSSTIYVDATAKLTKDGKTVDAEFSFENTRFPDEPNKLKNWNDGDFNFSAVGKFTAPAAEGTEAAVLYEKEINVWLFSVGISSYTSINNPKTNRRTTTSSISGKLVTNETGETEYVFDRTIETRLPASYSDYNVTLNINYRSGKNQYLSYSDITKAVAGRFNTLDEAADAEDIKYDLFTNGYSGDFSNGVDLTVFIKPEAVPALVKGDSPFVLHLNVKLTVKSSGSDNENDNNSIHDLTNQYFYLMDVKNEDGTDLNAFIPTTVYNSGLSIITYYDSYYKMHYQTALINDDTHNFDISKLKLRIDSPNGTNVYDAEKSSLIRLEDEYSYKITADTQDFSSGEIRYNVAASAGQGIYTVRVASKHTGGAKLFVNGPSKREVYFDSEYGFNHDILVANIGDADLTGLNVELSDAHNVKLDGYWVIGGEKNDTLAPFTSTYPDSMSNLAKIRLVPDGENKGEISGKLTISANGQEPVVIELYGHAGDPEIITNSQLDTGVKFVPYFAAVATDNVHDWNTVTYDVWSGRLPDGITLDPVTGEFLGVPTKAGVYDFMIAAEFSGNFPSCYKQFHIEVLDNTDENVYNATDEDYTLLTPIGSEQNNGKYDFRIANTDEDQLFVSNGTYGEFVDLWINGERMIPDEDYTSESGSTRITIKSQTLGKKLSSTTSNTIAAEFHVSGTTVVKRTAQNVSVGKITNGNKPNNNGGTGGVSGTHKPSEDLNIPSLNDPAVNDVVQKINDLPPVPGTNDAADIEAARKAYDSLTPDQKKLVYNLDKLTNAEEDIKTALPGTGKTDDGKDTTPADTDKKDDTTQPTTEAPVDPTETTEAPGESDVTAEATDEADVTAEATDESFGTTDATGEPEDSGYEQVVPAVKVFVFTFTDTDRNPLEGLLVELHSTVQNGVTDENGSVEFTDVEFGDHTLYVTDPATGETVSIAFTLNESNSFVFSGDSVSAADGSEIDMNVVYDGESLVFADADFTPAAEDPTSATEDSTSGDPFSDNKGNPYTGIRTTAIFGLCASSAALMFILRPRKKNTK